MLLLPRLLCYQSYHMLPPPLLLPLLLLLPHDCQLENAREEVGPKA